MPMKKDTHDGNRLDAIAVGVVLAIIRILVISVVVLDGAFDHALQRLLLRPYDRCSVRSRKQQCCRQQGLERVHSGVGARAGGME